MNRNRLPQTEISKGRRRTAAALAITLALGGAATEAKSVSNATKTVVSAVKAAGHNAGHGISAVTEHFADEQTNAEIERVREMPAEEKLKVTVDPKSQPIWNVAQGLVGEGHDPRELTDLMQAELHGDQPQSVEVPLNMVDKTQVQDLSQHSNS